MPREAVGERCQIMHMVNLLDIDIDLGDGTVVGADMPARSMQTYVFEGAAVEGK